jgi:hypothetical protein
MASASQSAIVVNGSDLTAYTFSVNIFTESSEADALFFGVGAVASGGLTGYAEATCDGVELTLVGDVLSAAGTQYAALFALDRSLLPDPTQTTVDVEIEFSGPCDRACCGAWNSPDGVVSPTDFAVISDPDTEFSLEVNPGAVIILIGITGLNAVAWDGIEGSEGANTSVLEGTNVFSRVYFNNSLGGDPLDFSASSATPLGVVAASFNDRAFVEVSDVSRRGLSLGIGLGL